MTPLSSTDGAGREDARRELERAEHLKDLLEDWRQRAIRAENQLQASRERTRVLEEALREWVKVFPYTGACQDSMCGGGSHTRKCFRVNEARAATGKALASLAAVAVEDGGADDEYGECGVKNPGWVSVEETRSARPVPAGEGADAVIRVPPWRYAAFMRWFNREGER